MPCPISPLEGWSAQKPPSGVGIDWGHPLAQRLLAYYGMVEGAGTRLQDLSGFGRHGRMIGAQSRWVPGRFGPAIYCNGLPAHVDCGSRFMPSGSFTIAGWFAPSELSRMAAVGQNGNSAGDFYLRVPDDDVGRPRLARWTGIDTNYQIWTSSTAAVVVANYWNFVATAYNHDLPGVLFCVNGEMSSPSASAFTSTSSEENFRIGRIGTSVYTGLVDSVSLYGRALQTDELLQLYRKPYCMFESGFPAAGFVRPAMSRGMNDMQELVGGLTG